MWRPSPNALPSANRSASPEPDDSIGSSPGERASASPPAKNRARRCGQQRHQVRQYAPLASCLASDATMGASVNRAAKQQSCMTGAGWSTIEWQAELDHGANPRGIPLAWRRARCRITDAPGGVLRIFSRREYGSPKRTPSRTWPGWIGNRDVPRLSTREAVVIGRVDYLTSFGRRLICRRDGLHAGGAIARPRLEANDMSVAGLVEGRRRQGAVPGEARRARREPHRAARAEPSEPSGAPRPLAPAVLRSRHYRAEAAAWSSVCSGGPGKARYARRREPVSRRGAILLRAFPA
jgi:hypothetical protein